ncbi:hypothetical protein [Nocardiopsis dassonvillei]|uniref:Secreted protein n=1 Tax=Nocardiopsis dassonvillei (strain ATCC 23218 / DSM 43111 / CIP 107115 / JCM 7437 / KCTC 9190 / NBRC 14626 / NCTC 10488 / NRRL B-5397 / IMRU 509) TaxID=446468 RepID=D7B5U6_NOCDD|nr:hypothetical protein [Nocardiopsis dassonvillei]ADH69189.1 hypothetical protein Ndas_3791 [Nocardiopsis dassonvillei subsp. dassonvillei DSM 43111]
MLRSLTAVFVLAFAGSRVFVCRTILSCAGIVVGVAVDGRTARLWRTEAPRTAADGPVELGVLAPEDADTDSVTVSVIGPRGGTAATEAAVSPGEWTRVRYPDDFEGAGGDPSTGVHTVVWSDTGSGTPLTCDGFEAV